MKIFRWDDDPDMEDPDQWVDPGGSSWDLRADYRDSDGHLWHWAGGFVSEHDQGFGYVPLMSRNDWSVLDQSLSELRHPMTRATQ